MALPMPLPAPVTMATFPLSGWSVVGILVLPWHMATQQIPWMANAERCASGAPESRSAAHAGGSQLPGRADGYPSGPPTDPYVRNSRIRFLKQSCCCPGAVHWPAVVRVGELNVSPLSPASGCSARRRLPSRGSLGPHFPTFTGTMRRYDCHLHVSGSFTCRSFPDTLPASVVRGVPYGLMARRKLQVTPGPLVTRSPSPGMTQG